MPFPQRCVIAVLFVLGISAPAMSQTAAVADEEVSLSGPRVGFTMLSDSVIRRIHDRALLDVSSPVTQFGWQFERRFMSQQDGLTAVTEWVVLVGGLEQSVVLPSVSWMVGLRTKNGAEFGIGPNLTPAGPALAIAAGMTFRAGALNFPLNVAVVPSKGGVRVSVLSGFNRR